MNFFKKKKMEDIINECNGTVLSNQSIIEEIKNKNIIIEPFNIDQLSTSSYDVTLGRNYYVCKKKNKLYNMYSKQCIDETWELHTAKKLKDTKYGPLENIDDEDEVIILLPGQNILSHTNEYIGGVNNITTMMKSKSSMGRSFITTCRCAGWGDVGYYNRWTMEITNDLNMKVILVVGRPIAQIVFLRTDKTSDSYDNKGTYQNGKDIEILKSEWTPNEMLPKLYNKSYIKK